jgi:hypothetical protein
MDTALQLIGLSLDILGAWLMSYAFFSTVPFWQIPFHLLRALVKPQAAHFTGRLSLELNGERRGHAVQGLGFLILGFVAQIIAVAISPLT